MTHRTARQGHCQLFFSLTMPCSRGLHRCRFRRDGPTRWLWVPACQPGRTPPTPRCFLEGNRAFFGRRLLYFQHEAPLGFPLTKAPAVQPFSAWVRSPTTLILLLGLAYT